MLGAQGFETAATGANHFTCLVERSWDKPFDDPEFWNQKMRGPICMNEAAVRTVLPMILERAEWAMSGVSKDEMARRSKTSAKASTLAGRGRDVLYAVQGAIPVRSKRPSLVSARDVLRPSHGWQPRGERI